MGIVEGMVGRGGMIWGSGVMAMGKGKAMWGRV